MPTDPRTPVIVGVAQHTFRSEDLAVEPLAGWDTAARSAAADAGIGATDLRDIDYLAVVDCMSWMYDDQVGRLAERLGANPAGRFKSEVSGTAGHVSLHRAAEAIRTGTANFALVCGGEALASVRRFARRDESPQWSFPAPPDTAPSLDLDALQHPGERATGMLDGVGAAYSFAMRDVARRAHLGIAPDEYRRQIGELMSGFTKVAAANPEAWFQTERTPDFLVEPRADNRFVAYPYTKHLMAMMDVDIFGALIIMSEAKADQMGIPAEKRVYPWTQCYAYDPASTGVRPHLWKSDAMEAAANAVLGSAGVRAEDIAHLDLYSCFPSAVNFARDALGVSQRPGERLTLTGGLAYGGGPAASYVVISLVKMTERLRTDPGSLGLVSGVGMLMSGHCFGIYSTTPPTNVKPIDQEAVQAEVSRVRQIPIRSDYTGPVTVATYTLMYDRQGELTHGAAICDLPDGYRAYARMLDPDLLAEAQASELVGRRLHMIAGEHAGELKAV